MSTFPAPNWYCLTGNPQIKAFSMDHVDLTTASCTLDNATNCRISKTNLVRPAHEILSILKKPFTSETAGRVRDSTCEDERQLLQSPSLVYSDIIKSQTEDLMQGLNVRGRNISELKVTDAFHLDGISQPFDCANQRVSDPQSLSSCTGLGATVICSRDVECTFTERRPPTVKPKHLAIPESDSKDQAVEILCHDKSDKVPEIEMNSHDSAPQFPYHLPEMKAEREITTYNMDEFPSFDLGF